MKKIITLLLSAALMADISAADRFVSFSQTAQGLQIATSGKPLPIVIDSSDNEGVLMAVESLRSDMKAVTGTEPEVLYAAEGRCIIIGTLGTPLIDRLVKAGKVSGKDLKGKREKYTLQVVSSPMAGVDRALVIAGSDRRGTIYGTYELSRQIGVSPWYWWMDVPIARHDDICVSEGTFTDGEPKVEYRGIFINDEWPCFGEWAVKKFGGINSKAYRHVFELLLRLKGNYMWPAMWGSAFYDDDPENGVLADRMGIVMGTSHHEPMALAQQDWKRRGKGEWDYISNAGGLQEFWTYGIERSKNWETLVTVGMRGDGDTPMANSPSVELMERIVSDQRDIISRVTGRPAGQTPQVWALYKEVQDFYDKGMKVPDDVTLLLCDDNWGNVRRLPDVGAKERKGGYGMYYHFDYVGGPRNSKWINISPIPRVWEQMNLTYRHGVKKIWIVNVGDLKPMEYPITFFMDMAWDPDRFNAGNLSRHSVEFCGEIFGEENAQEAARILRTYPKYNRRMTPELLSADTYVWEYGEWQRVREEYDRLALDAMHLRMSIPQEALDAYDELITYPVTACANLYDMYYAHAMNLKLAGENDPAANVWADRVEAAFRKDSVIVARYHGIRGGKWDRLAAERHIGYTGWNSPETQTMPQVKRVETAGNIFREKDGYVSMEAEHTTRRTDGRTTEWTVIPELGKTLSAITTMPCTANPDGAVLEYDMDITTTGLARVSLKFSPTLNFNVTGLRYAISFDGGQEQTVNINGDYDGDLGKWQGETMIVSHTSFDITEAGRHTLRVRPLDGGLVLQKIMVDMGGMRKSQLGPEETR